MEQKNFRNSIIYLVLIITFFYGVSLLYGERKNQSKLPSALVEATFFDVGQGDASLLRTVNNRYILIDGGPDDRVVKRLGEAMGPLNKKIDILLVSHPHADHIAGLNYVLERYAVGKVIIADNDYNTPDFWYFKESLKRNNVPVDYITEKKSIEMDGLKLTIFLADADKNVFDVNDKSLIVMANYQNCDFLYLGDVSGKSQDSLEVEYVDKLDVVKASHHGSRDGISEKLIKLTRPENVVFSAGKNNKYNHPSQRALDAYSGSKIFRTDQISDIIFGCDGSSVFVD